MLKAWEKAQVWEAEWHGKCFNSLNEELKQLVYAEKMGLITTPTPKTPYNFDLKGKRILDIGGGAYSLLLKCVNYAYGTTVIDPLMATFPAWVEERYEEAGIKHDTLSGEELDFGAFDEVWIYNVLQHTYDPKKVIENALQAGKVVRIFEWVGTDINIGHLHTLTEKDLNNWLKGEGKVENIDRNGAVGKCYYGVFKGTDYETSSNNN